MKNGKTELVFILDKSGSMAGLEGDTVGGFNSMIEKQKKIEGEVVVSTFLFSSDCVLLHDRVPLKQIGRLTDEDYFVGGSTALLDAIGEAINHIGKIHKYARCEDVPEKTMFIITTDGMENSSTRFTSKKIKAMIKHQEERYKWEFLFVAANIDAVSTGESIGIRKERSANYRASGEGTAELYMNMCDAIECFRENSVVDDGWADKFKK